MKKLIIISLLLLLQSKIIGQTTELNSEALKNQHIERIYQLDQVEIIPIAVDCNSKLEKEILKKCFEKSISAHVNRTFNAGLAYKLGLKPGLYKINVSFIISVNGEIVNISTEGTYKVLNNEAFKVINRLPKMTPGMMNGKNVNVTYSLPIALLVS